MARYFCKQLWVGGQWSGGRLLFSWFSHTFLQVHLYELQSVIDFGKTLKKVH